MPLFTVEATTVRSYSIEADTEQDALDAYYHGGCQDEEGTLEETLSLTAKEAK